MLGKKKKGIIAIILCLCMIFGMSGRRELFAGNYYENREIEDLANDYSSKVQANKVLKWDGITKRNIYEGEGYRVDYELVDHWEGGYKASVKIENTGNSTIENWGLSFVTKNKVANIWNAVIEKSENERIIIKNAIWNQDIAAGGSVEFGIVGKENFAGYPNEYQLISDINEVNEEDYKVEYNVNSDWETGFNAGIKIINNSLKSIEDWVLEFDYNRNIENIWNGIIQSHIGNHYIIKNAGYNSHIPSNDKVEIGFLGNDGSIEDRIEGAALYSYETNSGNKKIASKDENTRDETDTDDDGLFDYIEKYYNTDEDSEDTDGDGLSDYIELYSIVLDPCKSDTDENKVADKDEDIDEDGLSTIKEITLGTDILDKDTDSDGLGDKEEFEKYKTNPCKTDTDGDGVSDGKEIELETDPNIFNDKFCVTVRAEDIDTVKVSAKTEISGTQVESFTVKRFYSDFLFPESIPGYIGGAYDFKVDGTFENATIAFEFDEALLKNPEFDPVIYYYNEYDQVLEPLETHLEVNVATVNVNHFSKYILINRKEFEKSFSWIEKWEAADYKGVDIVLVIDDSGSMRTNDIKNERLEVAKKLIDELPENSRIGVINFSDNSTKLTSNLANEKEKAKSFLNAAYFSSSGGTDMYSAINNAFTYYDETSKDNRLKMMVVLSDGITSNVSLHSNTLKKADSLGVKIYTVGLGNNAQYYFNEYLKPLAEETKGAFYLASKAEELSNIYNDINVKIDIETDSDGDGIPDFYEENLKMFNGISLKLDKNSADTDCDGISDGEEITGFFYEYSKDKLRMKVTAKVCSNPTNEDSDGDGISDEEELTIGTDPAEEDSDGDGLSDGLEYIEYFDPLSADYDKDGISDKEEYARGTSPYKYDKKFLDYLKDVIDGIVRGDFIEETDNPAVLIGQILGSFNTLGDVRDLVANLLKKDYGTAIFTGVGLVPAIGDGVKTASRVGKFIVKNADDANKIVEILVYLEKNFPDLLDVMKKSDDFADAAKSLSKLDNVKLTKKQARALTKAFDKLGLGKYLLKTSDKANKLNVKRLKNVAADVWDNLPFKRGKLIDEAVNHHTLGIGLGENFPVVDRLDKKAKKLISTKSLDTAANGYQEMSKLKNTLNKYADALKNFEKNYMPKGILKWGGNVVSKGDYNTKVLEIVIPDTIITKEAVDVLYEFKKKMKKEGIQVLYLVTN